MKFLNFLVGLNVALVGTVLLLVLATSLLRLAGRRLRAADALRFHYVALALLIGFSVVASAMRKPPTAFAPLAKVWSAPYARALESAPSSGRAIVELPVLGAGGLAIDAVRENFLFGALVLIVVLSIAKLGRDLLALRRWLGCSFRIKRVGQVELLASDDATVPFSFWLPGRAFVIVPSSMIGASLRIAVAHELQHHRQGDTRWLFALAGLRALCVANPAFYLWFKWITEIQEFACDETLVDHGRVDSLAYARLLVEVANHGSKRESFPVCATGMAGARRPKQLHRRIRMMLSPRKQPVRVSRFTMTALCTLFVGAASFASGGLVQDRRVTLAEAQSLAKNARSHGAEFPLEINEPVLRQLNRLVGTPEGREFMQRALDRMSKYETMINAKIEEYGAPRELIAVPLIESGFQNRGQDPTHHEWGAGLWMFIESTARSFGLRVDATADDRLNVEKETDAALRYLSANELRFGDWRLAAMAYNIGEASLEKSIEKNGTRDPWLLIKNGAENDKDYLPKLVAAILILKNPDVLR